MTNEEVYQELRADQKPYALVKMSRQHFNEYMRRIKQDKCKPATLQSFFGKFGYVGDWNNWTKKESHESTLQLH